MPHHAVHGFKKRLAKNNASLKFSQILSYLICMAFAIVMQYNRVDITSSTEYEETNLRI
jgi:hypothetical protein